MPDRPRNAAVSVRQRLTHARGLPAQLLLSRPALERLLHRLSPLPGRERFVRTRAMLRATWFDRPQGATRDVDLLAFGGTGENALVGIHLWRVTHRFGAMEQ